MVISTGASSVMTLLMSFFSGEDQQINLGIILIVNKIFFSLNQTAVDALALKEYSDKAKMSFLQTIVFRLGTVTGGILFLKLISRTFCLHFGRTEPLMTLSGFFMSLSVIMMVMTVLCHFLY